MIALLEQNRQKIQQLCEKHHVRKLSVFGSAARQEDFSAFSDIDIFVEFRDVDSMHYLDDYFALPEALEHTLARKVDMLTGDLSKMRNPYLRQSIMEDLQLFYTDASLHAREAT